MHFIGMLAFHLPIPLAYDIPITLVSIVPAIVASAIALWTVRHGDPGVKMLLVSAVVMGAGISIMHYTGMAAMKMQPSIAYDPLLFALSVTIAIVASLAALKIILILHTYRSSANIIWLKLGSAAVMAVAITGMHYTGMAAANFSPNSMCLASPDGLSGVWMALLIAAVSLMVMLMTLVVSIIDARLGDQNARMAEQLKLSNNELVQAEHDRRIQMNALAEANVRMMLFHATMEDLRQVNTNFAEVDDDFSRSILGSAMEMTGARYGAIGLFNKNGVLQKFLTQGISEEERKKIGPYPTGKGLLEAFYRESKVVRVERISDDPRSCGFPPGHPPMTSLLGVPLVVNGLTKGVIYLSDKHGSEAFTGNDEMLMDLLAGEIVSVLKRSELMASLRDSNAQTQLLLSQLQQRNDENNMLIYSVSHDLRSPLVNLQGFSKELVAVSADIRGLITSDGVPAEIQKRGLGLIDSDMKESINFIQAGVARLSNIIDAMLRLARAGKVEYHWTEVDTGLIVKRIVDSMQAVSGERGAAFTVSDLPPVWGDATAVDQIFANLIGNALNYLDPKRPGLIEIGWQADADSHADTHASMHTYYVRDNGLGMSELALGKLFQIFQRFHPDQAKGEGVGLSIVRRMVERHNGKIWAESSVGVGTTFFISLPIQTTEEAV